MLYHALLRGHQITAASRFAVKPNHCRGESINIKVLNDAIKNGAPAGCHREKQPRPNGEILKTEHAPRTQPLVSTRDNTCCICCIEFHWARRQRPLPYPTLPYPTLNAPKCSCPTLPSMTPRPRASAPHPVGVERWTPGIERWALDTRQ